MTTTIRKQVFPELDDRPRGMPGFAGGGEA
jgi:hypothetical protein